MPTYEYACSSCQHEWEFEQSIKDPAITECPSCHAATAKRQISRGTGFILKGSGWYADLYSSSSNKPAEGTKDEGSKPSGSTGSGTGTGGSSEGSGGTSSGGTSSGGSSGSSGSTPAPSGSSTKSTSDAT